jgi:hypothetical protein
MRYIVLARNLRGTSVAKKAKRINMAGRKPDPNAKRKQTTKIGQGRDGIKPTDEMIRHRVAVTGDARVGLDSPLDVLYSQGLIDADMRDEGLRFATLSWSIYGFPLIRCEAIYRRMVSGGLESDNGARDGATLSPERLDWLTRQERLLEQRTALLTGPEHKVLCSIAQHLELPKFLLNKAERCPWQDAAFLEYATLVSALRKLVRAKGLGGDD